MNGLVIFDVDGVLLSEERYFDAAALAAAATVASCDGLGAAFEEEKLALDQVASLGDVRRLRERFLPDGLIRALRERAVNSNWDKACAAALLALEDVLKANSHPRHRWTPRIHEGRLWTSRLRGAQGSGVDFMRELEGIVRQLIASGPKAEAAQIPGTLCEEVKERFQRYFLGDEGATNTFLRMGLASYDEPLLPAPKLRATLEALIENGWTLGIGTGRPRVEAVRALDAVGAWALFDPDHICTFDEVRARERQLQLPAGDLAKPHPYTFVHAKGNWKGRVLVVGDSPADYLAATAALCDFIGVGSARDFPRMEPPATGWVDSVAELPPLLGRA